MELSLFSPNMSPSPGGYRYSVSLVCPSSHLHPALTQALIPAEVAQSTWMAGSSPPVVIAGFDLSRVVRLEAETIERALGWKTTVGALGRHSL